MIFKWIILGLIALFLLAWIMNIANIFLEKLMYKIGKWYMVIVLALALAGCLYFNYCVVDIDDIGVTNGIIFGVIEFVCFYLVFPNIDDESHYEREIYTDFWDDVRVRTKEVFTPGWLSKLGGVFGCLFVSTLLFWIPWSPFIVFGIQAVFIIYVLWQTLWL